MVYAGTPEFAVPALQRLIEQGFNVVAVYTQPDRPAGRGRKLRASAVKQVAEQHDLALEQPASLRDPEVQAQLQAYAPDVMVVAAYGLILPQAVLDTPRLGCLNIHASLLPRWRGAAPIHRAIEAGDEQTGVCLMEMAAGLDTGPVVACRKTPIGPLDTTGSLHDRLAELGAKLLVESLEDWAHGHLPATPQPAEGVTYAEKITSEEARIDWRMPAQTLGRRVQAFHPWPVARCLRHGEWLRIHQAQVIASSADRQAPGTVVAVSDAGIDVQTGDGVLRLLMLQAPGRKAQPVDVFLRGQSFSPGERLE